MDRTGWREPDHRYIRIRTVLFPVASFQAASADTEDVVHYFPETGHNLSGQAKAFYAPHGGQAIFGLPITEVIADGAERVQYFERAQFELRPRGITLTLSSERATFGQTF